MRASFPPDGKIILPVFVVGPRESFQFRLTVDTGAERTVLSASFLRAIGVDLSRTDGTTRLRTATGTARAPLVRVPAVSALGRVRTDLLVAAHDFPLGIETDGLLGLDFFRGLVLRVDFARGRIALTSPKRWWQFWHAS